MDELRESSNLVDDPARLRRRLDEDGYVFFRALVPPDDVHETRRAMTDALASVGWLAPDRDPLDAIPSASAVAEGPGAPDEFFIGYEALQRVQAFHELAHHESLSVVFRGLLGDRAFVHPRKIARVPLPGDLERVTPPHQDFRLIQGTGDVLTTWMPIGDCPEDLGGLQVLAGSHRYGLLPVRTAPGVGGVAVDVDIAADDSRWVSSQFESGDVLIFHSLTIHAARPNRTDALRISADYRVQSADDPVVPASLAPHYHPRLPGYPELTRGWTAAWSVESPEGLIDGAQFDPFDPEIGTPRSRLLSLPA